MICAQVVISYLENIRNAIRKKRRQSRDNHETIIVCPYDWTNWRNPRIIRLDNLPDRSSSKTWPCPSRRDRSGSVVSNELSTHTSTHCVDACARIFPEPVNTKIEQNISSLFEGTRHSGSNQVLPVPGTWSCLDATSNSRQSLGDAASWRKGDGTAWCSLRADSSPEKWSLWRQSHPQILRRWSRLEDVRFSQITTINNLQRLTTNKELYGGKKLRRHRFCVIWKDSKTFSVSFEK